MMASFRRTASVGLILSFCIGTAELRADVWGVGLGGQAWEEPAQTMAGVVVGEGQALGPASFSLEQNITQFIVWGVGAPSSFIAEGNGRVWNNSARGIAGSEVLVDGDGTTSTENSFKEVGVNQRGRIFFMDLGASFPVSQVVFYPREGEDEFVAGYEISLNDGRTFDANDSPVYEAVRQVTINRDPRVDVRFPTQLVRFIQLRVLSPNPFELAEIEVHGEGFVPRGLYETQLIQFAQPVNYGALTFRSRKVSLAEEGENSASTDEQVRVIVQMRNGVDETPLDYYQIADVETRSEVLVSKEEYEELPLVLKGSIRPDATHWSSWTEPLIADSSGTYSIPLDLPGPRDFFQVRLRFEGNTSASMQIDSLAIVHTPPLAALALSEVALLDDPFPAGGRASVPAGRDTVFTYDIKADLGEGTGFDGVRISTLIRPEFLKLEMGHELEEIQPDSVHVDDTGLRVYFPSRRISTGEDVRLRITFRSQALLFSTQFIGQLLDTTGSLPQRIAEGDATREVGTDSQEVIFLASGESVLQSFAVSPPVITPNGDGINDSSAFSFVLIHLVQPAAAELLVYDLSGRVIKNVLSDALIAGRYTQWHWDGTNNAGDLVPPGTYIARASVEAAADEVNRTSLIHVAY